MQVQLIKLILNLVNWDEEAIVICECDSVRRSPFVQIIHSQI